MKKEIHTKCPHKTEITIKIKYAVYCKIKKLVEKIKTEWLGYLDYEKLENVFIVTDIVVPDQVATWGSVTVKDTNLGIGKGVIHSHHPFDDEVPGPSITDEDYLEQNHPFSLIVSSSMKFSGIAVVKMPCGESFRIECKVKTKYPEPDIKDFLTESLKNIKNVVSYNSYKNKNKHKNKNKSNNSNNNKNNKFNPVPPIVKIRDRTIRNKNKYGHGDFSEKI